MPRKTISPTDHFAAKIEEALAYSTPGMRAVFVRHLVSEAYFLGVEHGLHNMALAHGVDLDELHARLDRKAA